MTTASPVNGLDHIILVCPDMRAGSRTYTALLGREPDWMASSGGVETAIFRVANTSLELMAPGGSGAVANRLRELLATRGPGLTSLVFRSADLQAAHRMLTRRGLAPDSPVEGSSTDLVSGQTRRWSRFRCPDALMAGIKTFVIEPEAEMPLTEVKAAVASSLDHVVISTPNPDRAVALYGGRLGLDLRLDRTSPEWKTRFLFFRLGSLILEVIHSLEEKADPRGQDSLWGLTWSVADLEAAHGRLASADIDISDIRSGRKPGSSVFTVRSGTLGVPTLFISHSPR